LDTIETANRFLIKQKATAATINVSMLDAHEEGNRFVPVCFMETVGENNVRNKSVYQPQEHPVSESSQLIEMMKDYSYGNSNEESVSRFFNQEVAAHFNNSGEHENRVREMVLKLFSDNRK
jgi:hypothetical protein